MTQLCVDPAHRGRGLARKLMRYCAENLESSGFRTITLTVTEANLQAIRVYDELGFQTRHRFEAMVYER